MTALDTVTRSGAHTEPVVAAVVEVAAASPMTMAVLIDTISISRTHIMLLPHRITVTPSAHGEREGQPICSES